MKETASPILFGIIVASEQASALPLEHTAVDVQITGLAALVSVSQRFRNPFTAPSNLEYLFPLPQQAALSDFELRIGERLVTAQVEELGQARRTFDEARQSGQRAGLLEQRRPNLFAVQLANVQPGETILVTLRYTQPLAYRDEEVEFVFPMGLTPRYHSQQHPQEAAGVDAPLVENLAEVGPVEIGVQIDSGAAIAEPHSPTHKLRGQLNAQGLWAVTLDGLYLPDHDFVLRYALPARAPVLAAWRSLAKDGDYFMLTLLPPSGGELPQAEPREYIFVLDRSGSMSGAPIRQAVNALRACLRTLNPRDRFYILLFDDKLEWYQRGPCPVDAAAIRQVDAFLDRVDGRGGTEFADALYAALSLNSLPDSASRQRIVVFITDGAVSSEQRILTQTRRYIGAARLFTFGIGPSVNRALLEQLALEGCGMAEFLALDEDIEAAIMRFQDRISFPLLTGLSLAWEGGKVWDVYPERLPDLYAGQPLQIAGRMQAGRPLSARLSGQRGAEHVTLEVALPMNESPAIAAARLWASKRIEALLRQQTFQENAAQRHEIIALALAHNLATPYTAFVAVDQPRAAVAGQKILIAQPLPQGLDPQGFMAQAMPTFLSASAPGQPRAASAGGGRLLLKEKRADKPVSDGDDEILFCCTEAEPEEFAPELERAAPQNAARDAAEVLKRLARTQEMDGSWHQDVTWTAAALLAFLRNGHTARKGHYRVQVQRAFTWLAGATAAGQAAFWRALALQEAAAADPTPFSTGQAQAALVGLPAPQTELEQALSLLCLGQPAERERLLDELLSAATGQASSGLSEIYHAARVP